VRIVHELRRRDDAHQLLITVGHPLRVGEQARVGRVGRQRVAHVEFLRAHLGLGERDAHRHVAALSRSGRPDTLAVNAPAHAMLGEWRASGHGWDSTHVVW
jgi:hypothetical protein